MTETRDRSRVIPLAKTPVNVTVLEHGTLDVKLAAPARPNRQTPHAQDEVCTTDVPP